jgi:hypothetical protein
MESPDMTKNEYCEENGQAMSQEVKPEKDEGTVEGHLVISVKKPADLSTSD